MSTTEPTFLENHSTPLPPALWTPRRPKLSCTPNPQQNTRAGGLSNWTTDNLSFLSVQKDMDRDINTIWTKNIYS